MTRRLFDHNPMTGETQWFHYDETNDTFLIESVQDLEPMVEAAKASFNSYSGNERWGNGRHVAYIPNVFMQELMISGKIKDKDYMRRWLNNPDHAAFRTSPGRV